jgi:spore photoproduct lyase
MKSFSHVYIEQDAYRYPVTQQILESINYKHIINIQNYKNFFNRTNQSFQAQKKSTKLILAVKKDNFSYKGSDMSDNFGHEHFYYNTTIQNCIYNCDYCYLQGMFNSANIVIYVNITDFFEHTNLLLKTGSVFLCISYDTDLLALETVVPYTTLWIDYARPKENLTMEVRTKSHNFSKLASIEPPSNTILAWTVSPEEIVKKYEKRTPSLKVRLQNINAAIQRGWRTRICMDPILYIENWREVYSTAIDSIFSGLQEPSRLEDVTVGVFRVNTDYLKKMRRQNPSPALHFPFLQVGNIQTYSPDLQNNILDFVSTKISTYYPKEKIRCYRECE